MPNDWKYRAVKLPGAHPLVGQVVEVRELVYSESPDYARRRATPGDPAALLLIYADGRQVCINPCGHEADGINAFEPSEKEELVD